MLKSDEPVQYLPGVGPANAALFAKLGIHTVEDLLQHYPRRYEDRTQFVRIADAPPGQPVVLRGAVSGVQSVSTSRRGMQITKVLVSDPSGSIQLVFFQQPYLTSRFQTMAEKGGEIILYGAVKSSMFGPAEMDRFEWEPADRADPLSVDRIVPIYPLTEGLAQRRVRSAVFKALEVTSPPEECLPPALRERFELIDARSARRNIHFPDSQRMMHAARRRTVFEELFLVQMLIMHRRRIREHGAGGAKFEVPLESVLQELAGAVPFPLTGAQKRVLAELHQDLTSGSVMHRLVQGDVGCGKTLVAVGAMLMAARSGFQSALMAPTEVLALQHANSLRELLEPLGLRIALHTGSQRSRVRADARMATETGLAQVVVGTHALISDGTKFHRLGLAIVDEQHRFGVHQRRVLGDKGREVHLLMMTATPIPRTLTMTLYGDMEVSVIDELPPGRKSVKTHWKRSSERAQVYAGVEALLRQGRQAYVVCPLVEDSEKLEAQAATQLAESLRTGLLSQWRVGLMHGRLTPEEKTAVMQEFKQHRLDVLVSTTVIEVGVDVANAAVMVIENADRFGLAQLHQLRGRVGRGAHASFCVLIADPSTEEGAERLRVLCQTDDGFRIAEEDLRLRGPGDILGTRQSGLPDLKLADLLQDADVLREARSAAEEIVRKDPDLTRIEHAALRQRLQVMEKRLGAALVG